MTRWRRTIAALMVMLSVSPVAFAGDDEREQRREAPTYESPLLSLVLLPFNILIRMASVFEEEKPAGAARDRTEKR